MSSENWFSAIFVWPLSQLINYLTPKLGVAGGIAIVTILVNAVLAAVTLKSTIATQQMQLLQPELNKITKKYEGKTDDASRSAFSRIHGNDSTAYYKRDDEKDLPARPFDDIPASKTEKAKIHSQHKPGCHGHTISQRNHHKTAPFVLYFIKPS